MVQIYCEFPRKVMQNRKIIAAKLKIKISKKGHIMFLEGNAETEYISTQFIEAINTGFSVIKALSLIEENFVFEKINIKNVTKRSDLERVRARIIGTKGKALATLESITHCHISLHDNTVGILGTIEDVQLASLAVKKIIMGSKHSNVYSYLEKQVTLTKTQLR